MTTDLGSESNTHGPPAAVGAVPLTTLGIGRVLLVHLRLPFQLLLAPIFLWGWLLAGGGFSVAVAAAFLALHVFLYGGVTAFNSYYDRDEGPVGGLERPPPVVEALLPFSLAAQGVGAILAWLIDPWFFALYGAFVALSVAYSHPAIRLKAQPVGSLAVVAFGQGVLAFLCAWAAVRGEIASAFEPVPLLAAFASALIVLGLYPLTQLYQIDEDRRRGDRTVAVVWGANGAFAVTVTGLATGGLAMSAVAAVRYGAGDAALLGTALLGGVLAVAAWWRRYDPRDVLPTYRRVMRLSAVSAAALGGYLAFHLIAR